MTQEDKELLLVDLCARLPYGVKIRMIHHEIKGADPEYVDDVFSTTHYNMIDYDDDNYEFLPFLRPMSSMTDEEKEYYYTFIDEFSIDNRYPQFTAKYVNKKLVDEYIDWLNEHHFDYRGLIEKNLAIEAPEGMYKQ